METINLDNIRRNAYRVLGLTGRATQEEIEAAARMMRLLASGDVPPTPNDAIWLGPVRRGGGDVESALTRLTDPELRARERLWWYCDTPPATEGGVMVAGGATGSGICQMHDAALTAFCGLLVKGTDRKSLNMWVDLLGECREIGRSDAYLQWMLEVERGGDFEKAVSLGELASLQRKFAEEAATALVGLADDCLAEDNYGGAGRVYDILRDVADGGGGAAGAAMERILSRMEDALIGHCNELTAQVDDAWKTRRADLLKSACSRVRYACDGKLAGLTGELVRLLACDPDRALRLRGEFVAVYVHIADAYEAAHDKYSARKTLLGALNSALGTAAEPRLRERIHLLASAKPVGVHAAGGGEVRNYFGGGGTKAAALVIVLMLLGLLRGLMSSSTRISSDVSDQVWRNGIQRIQSDPEIQRALREIEQRVPQPVDPESPPGAFERLFRGSQTQPAAPAGGLSSGFKVSGTPATGPGVNLTAPPLSLEPIGPVTNPPVRGRGNYVPPSGTPGMGFPPGGAGAPRLPAAPGSPGNYGAPRGGR